MGREVRMVPENWKHPKNSDGKFIPLFDSASRSFANEESEWNEGYAKWQAGLCEQYGKEEKWGAIDSDAKEMRYSDYAGSRPSPDDYMPDWPLEQRTHYMMYEDTTEGTPISPVFATAEELARWLTDNNASAFGSSGASYEGWLRVCNGGFACSAVMINGKITSGVDGLTAA